MLHSPHLLLSSVLAPLLYVLPLEVNVDLLMEVVVCVEWFIYGID